ncbi:hypothetical protein [Xanthovirga aplysinae]|uniref:hypothetical protein n=1 Tax=Xanthovirga aplysinae TaxID=2529853 RepID=UPI0012BC3E8C|nr:hypothetical protein [Xanthovirga aplysinae]MTI29794.1 hypothetical protein [Xanthovirga aplysinae]
MGRSFYKVEFTGYGSLNSRYRQSLNLEIRHDWSNSEDDAISVLIIIREEIRKHFQKFEIHSIDKS